jgi:sulfite exporter TauE/SafE
MENLFTVLILGLSAEGILLCPFFAFGLALSDKMAGLRFLFGRLSGLMCFGIIICLIGNSIHINEKIINLLFGIIISGFGIYRIVVSNRSFINFDTSGNGLNPAGKCFKSTHEKNAAKAGFGLGFFRGFLNPGRKYIYLAPLLLGAGLLKGTAITFIYGLSSSVYLVIGFVSAELLTRMTKWKRQVGTVGGLFMVILGIIYALKPIIGLKLFA